MSYNLEWKKLGENIKMAKFEALKDEI